MTIFYTIDDGSRYEWHDDGGKESAQALAEKIGSQWWSDQDSSAPDDFLVKLDENGRPLGTFRVSVNMVPRFHVSDLSRRELAMNAADGTKIAELQEEIEAFGWYDFNDKAMTIKDRTLKRLKSALAELMDNQTVCLPCGHHVSLKQTIGNESYCELCYRMDCLAQSEERERKLREALERQNKYMSCCEGAKEYPSDGCNCDACEIQREVDAALNPPTPEGEAPMDNRRRFYDTQQGPVEHPSGALILVLESDHTALLAENERLKAQIAAYEMPPEGL